MKLTKGQWIYLIILLISIILLILPNATALFSLEFSAIKNRGNGFAFIPDILSVLNLLLGYIMIRLFYRKHSFYVRRYPYFALFIVMLWTIVVQIK